MPVLLAASQGAWAQGGAPGSPAPSSSVSVPSPLVPHTQRARRARIHTHAFCFSPQSPRIHTASHIHTDTNIHTHRCAHIQIRTTQVTHICMLHTDTHTRIHRDTRPGTCTQAHTCVHIQTHTQFTSVHRVPSYTLQIQTHVYTSRDRHTDVPVDTRPFTCTHGGTQTRPLPDTHTHLRSHTQTDKPELPPRSGAHVQCVSSIQGFEGLTGWTRWGRGTRAVSQAPRLRGYGRDVEVAGPGVGGWRGRDWVVESPRGQAPASLAERRRERRFALGAGREGWEVPRAVAADTGRHGHPCPPGAPEVFQLPPSAAPLLSSGLRGMSPWEWPQAELGGSWASTPLIHPWGLRITRGACSSVGWSNGPQQ